MRSIRIGGWLKSSFIDFPGLVATVLFFPGCNLCCGFCHNPHLVNGTSGFRVTEEEFRSFLKKRKGIIDGVVLSGGEPTVHCEDALLVSSLARKEGCRVKLDTNGMEPGVIERLSPDYCALDVKTRPADYGTKLGASYPDAADRLVRSIAIARKMGPSAEIRVTAVPGLINREIAREIGKLCRGIYRIFIQPMHRNSPLLDPYYEKVKPIPPAEIEEFRTILARYVTECVVRGAQ
ncbi:MAG: anaerobic ribonucleoside-triphosphate reductase activating protein [Chitinivibrionales bacterium]|nr:anaerobic ribonucleoside-triphosphate reductase activating protein [Chitinivibrionales bacterium]